MAATQIEREERGEREREREKGNFNSIKIQSG
jgi:hypothetical protein